MTIERESFIRNKLQFCIDYYSKDMNRVNLLVLIFFIFYFRPHRGNIAPYSVDLALPEPPIKTYMQ